MRIKVALIAMPLFATWVAVNEVFLALTIDNDMISKDRDVLKL